MRKIILFNMMTLNGYFEGLNRSIDWHNVDAEFNEFAKHQLKSVDTILFGRITYDLMASYWTSSEALTNDPDIVHLMNSKLKIVISRTMEKAAWHNTLLIKENVEVEIKKLKQLPGKDLILFGGANLLSTFQQLDLIDEYRIMLNPIILKQGMPLFKETSDINLKLTKAKPFNSGNVLLCYEPKRHLKTTTSK